jgi:hypothetical protein
VTTKACVARAITWRTAFRAIVASSTGQRINAEATRTSRRTTIPGRADVSWVFAVIVAIFLAVTTGPTNWRPEFVERRACQHDVEGTLDVTAEYVVDAGVADVG